MPFARSDLALRLKGLAQVIEATSQAPNGRATVAGRREVEAAGHGGELGGSDTALMVGETRQREGEAVAVVQCARVSNGVGSQC